MTDKKLKSRETLELPSLFAICKIYEYDFDLRSDYS